MNLVVNGRLITLLRMLVSGALLILLAIMAARITWLVLTPETAIQSGREQVALPTNAPISQPDRQAASSASMDLLMGFNPFSGKEEAPVEIVEPLDNFENLPDIGLDIVYKGSRAVSDETGAAFITVPGSDKDVYLEGDELIDGYTIYRIEATRLIVERNGERAAVPYREESVITGIERPEEELYAPVNSSTNDTAAGGAVAGQNRPAASGSAENTFTVAASDLLQNARPVRRTSARGLSIGLGFETIGDRRVLDRAGLRSDDVITAINGISFLNIDDQEMLELVTSGGALDLTVQRQGADAPITVNLVIEKET